MSSWPIWMGDRPDSRSGGSQLFSVSLFLNLWNETHISVQERVGAVAHISRKRLLSWQLNPPSWGRSWAILTELLWWAAGWGGKSPSAPGSLLSALLGYAKIGYAKALQTHQGLLPAALETGPFIPLSLQGVQFCVCVALIALCLPKITWYFFFLLSHVFSRRIYFLINTTWLMGFSH